MHTIPQRQYLLAAQVFHWASKEHYSLLFTGQAGRHKRTEVLLHRLSTKGKLRAIRYGHKLIYAAIRKSKRGDLEHIEHGLACTEALVRFWRSRTDCVIVPEKKFRGFEIIPEWGIIYPNHKMILFEFCSADNCNRPHLIRSKVNRYKEFLPQISEKFNSDAFIVLVMDIAKQEVENYVKNDNPGDSFMVTDYQTFLSVPLGSQLSAPIYIWGGDGERYGLSQC